MRVHLRQLLRTLRRDESGQSLIVIVSAMTVLLGIAAFAIDAASWMVRHHDAQIVADSAALAAAQCLADPGQANQVNQQPLPVCGNGSDIQHAQQVAVAYAAANGLTITATDVNVDTTNDVVTVSDSTTTPGLLARVFGIGTTSQSARAGAGWKDSSACTTAGQNCDFMFANSSSCSSAAAVLNAATQGSSTINGNIQTNGWLNASGIGNAGGINGTGNYGSACPGGTSDNGGNKDPWKDGDPTQATAPMTWPIDYSKDFPACVQGSTTNPCHPPGTQHYGYPMYCTNTGSNIVLNDSTPADTPQPGQIYCASGTSTNLGDPSTWNGSITITMSGNNQISDTFVASTISYSGSGGDTISACGYTASGYSASTCTGSSSGSPPAPAGGTANYPIFYAVGADASTSQCAAGTSSSCALSLASTGNLALDGDVFVENGTASLNFQGNQSAANTFIEANAITATLAGNFNGDGPSPSGSGSSSGGSITLVQ
jgi:hypothetical protein